MSHGTNRHRGHRKRTRAEAFGEEEAEMESEYSQANEEVDEERTTQANTEVDEEGPWKTTSETNMVEELCLQLELDPENEEIKTYAKRFIRKMYLNNGGLPINTGDSVPTNINGMNAQELSNVLENMVLAKVRTKKNYIVDKALNVVANATYLSAAVLKHPIGKNLIDQVNSDDILKTSIVEVFLGGISQLNPLFTLIITAASHASNLLVKYIDGKHTGTVSGPTSSSSSSSSSATGNQTQGTKTH